MVEESVFNSYITNWLLLIVLLHSIIKILYATLIKPTMKGLVLETINTTGETDLDKIAKILESPRLPAAASLGCLGKRGFV